MIELNTPVEIIEKIAIRIENERRYQHITQQDLCDKAGVSLGTYRDFVYKQKINLENLIKLLFALRMFKNIQGLLKEREAGTINDIIKSDLPKRVRK